MIGTSKEQCLKTQIKIRSTTIGCREPAGRQQASDKDRGIIIVWLINTYWYRRQIEDEKDKKD